MRVRTVGRTLAAAAVAATIATVPAATSQATAPNPGLRLLVGTHHVDVQRYDGDPGLYLPASLFVASTNGPFELHPIVRPSGTIALWQVRRTSHGAERIRRIDPVGSMRLERGLPHFFRTTLVDSGGHVVAQQTQPFCPVADYGAARVGTSGPPLPAYPYFCGSVLTRKMVWGIDRGWAAQVYPELNVSPADAPDGNYSLVVRINRAYVRQLHLDPRQARATLSLTITTQDGYGCPPLCAARPATSLRQSARLAVAAGRTTSASSFGSGRPNLAALPAHDFRIEHNGDNGHDYLDFAATIWNAGPGLLDVEGFRHTDANGMVAKQVIYHGSRPATVQRIGRFEFDTRPGHHHWHLEDVAQYDVLDAAHHRVVRSHKQSFCLAPTDPIDLTVDGALWQPDKIGLYSSCPSDESIWLRETMPVGWGDTYVQSAAGQSFDITSLDNGVYFIRVTTNPNGRILETTRSDDQALFKVHLGGSPGARTVESLGIVGG